MRLEGIEPDNLLGFLALLGLLRSLERSRPRWKVRTHWEGIPRRPWLTVFPGGLTRDEVGEAAADGCAALALVHEFEERDIFHDRGLARVRLLAATSSATPGLRDGADLWSSLFTDGAAKDDGTVKATPLCAMFGGAHQHFLERLRSVPRGELPKELAKLKNPPDLNSPEKLIEALLTPWQRQDKTESFRWDPLEDRRYALRFKNPSTDKGMTVHGANRLASIALPLLTVAPVVLARQQSYALCIGSARERGEWKFRWPVWRRPASLAAIRGMLATGGGPVDYPAGLGVEQVYETTRITAARLMNFTRAQPME